MGRSIGPLNRLVKTQFRWLAGRFLQGMVAFALVLAVSGARAAEQSLVAKLQQPMKLSTTLEDLREIGDSLRQASGVPIFFDRRINPRGPWRKKVVEADDVRRINDEATIRPATEFGPNLQGAFEEIGALTKAVWATDGFVVIIGPGPQVTNAATVMMDQWQQLQNQRSVPNRDWLNAKKVAWDDIVTPDEILQQIGQLWGLDVSDVRLPYDLWHAADLGEVPVTTALGVLGVGFDLSLTVNWATGQVQAIPLQDNAVCKVQYSVDSLASVHRDRILSAGNGAKANLVRAGEGWLLSGSADHHWEMQRVLYERGKTSGRPRGAGGAGGAAGGGNANMKTTYTLRLAERADKVLRYLSETAKMKIVFEEGANEPAQTRVELEAKDKTILELMELVAAEAGLKIVVEGDQVTVSAQ